MKWVLLIVVYSMAILIQSHMVLNGDVSTLMHETQKLLQGGTYAHDFFEPKPPMILYLYIVPVIVAKVFSLQFTLTLPVYVFLLASCSLGICYFLLKKIFFLAEENELRFIVMLVLTVLFLVLPLGELGQGENLLIILTLPYLLTVVCRLQNKTIPFGYLVLIGIMAGLGFAIKPQYLMTLLFVEIYVMAYQRRLWSWLRLETFITLAVLLVYLLSIWLFHRDYIFYIVPHVARFYYSTLGAPWTQVWFNPGLIYCSITFLLFAATYHFNTEKLFSGILLMALTGFMGAFVIQDTPWYYHLYPAFSIAILTNVLLVSLLVKNQAEKWRDYAMVCVVAVVMGAFIFYFAKSIWVLLVFAPRSFFTFFFVLFVGLFFLLQPKTSFLKMIVVTSLIMGVSFVFTYFAAHTPWFSHRFLLTLCLLLMGFILCVKVSSQQKVKAGLMALIAMLVFAYPWYNSLASMADVDQYKYRHQSLVNFLTTYAAHHSIYFISSVIEQYPILDYVPKINYASRYPCLVWLPSLIKYPDAKDKTYYLDSVAEELMMNKPDFVLIDIKKNKKRLDNIQIDYLPYFLTNTSFRKAWASYHYFMTVENYPTYQFAVYAR